MYLFARVEQLQRRLRLLKSQGRTIGFVPTMGALHEGHLSLLQQCHSDGCVAVCSIFVNPTQFNEASDLEKYPRTPANDVEMLLKVGCEVLFMPPVAEIYDQGMDTRVDLPLGHLETAMEGQFRPSHFVGVVQVVKRLLDIVEPEALYMGQKDYQQVAIIRHLIRALKLPVKLVMGATVRESDGLAMSSRNVRLTPAQRQIAPQIYQTLLQAKAMATHTPPAEISQFGMRQLERLGFRPEYFEIVDADTLETVTEYPSARQMVACVAAWLGEIRLIDNLLFFD
jgi:pantoate--beta-alanine ligase